MEGGREEEADDFYNGRGAERTESMRTRCLKVARRKYGRAVASLWSGMGWDGIGKCPSADWQGRLRQKKRGVLGPVHIVIQCYWCSRGTCAAADGSVDSLSYNREGRPACISGGTLR